MPCAFIVRSASRGGRAAPPRSESGAVAIEAVIVSLLLFTIVAGIVDVSMVFRDAYQVTLASRAAARTAAADPLAPTMAQNSAAQVASALRGVDPSRVTRIWVYKASTVSGAPVSGAGCSASCYRFTLDAAGNPVAAGGTWPARSACAGGVVDAVGVEVQYRHKAPIRLFDGHLLTERTVMSFEPQPSSVVCVAP